MSTYKAFDSFAVDLMQFVKDICVSVPKSYAKFKELVRRKKAEDAKKLNTKDEL